MGASKAWKIPIHKTISKLKQRFGLTWIRTQMSYHRFTNLREIFQGDLTRKLTLDVESKDFQTRECNCRPGNGEKICGYNNVCRHPLVVYKATCKHSGKFYIGNTQRTVKERITQHFTDTKNLLYNEQSSDSWAKHFANIFQNCKDKTGEERLNNTMQRNMIDIEILWQGNPISCVKSFRTSNCKLCTKERIAIYKHSKTHPDLLINSCNELYGACRHKPKFHRYTTTESPSADDSNKDERVQATSKVTTEI